MSYSRSFHTDFLETQSSMQHSLSAAFQEATDSVIRANQLFPVGTTEDLDVSPFGKSSDNQTIDVTTANSGSSTFISFLEASFHIRIPNYTAGVAIIRSTKLSPRS